jgi:hypothetical protein
LHKITKYIFLVVKHGSLLLNFGRFLVVVETLVKAFLRLKNAHKRTGACTSMICAQYLERKEKKNEKRESKKERGRRE